MRESASERLLRGGDRGIDDVGASRQGRVGRHAVDKGVDRGDLVLVASARQRLSRRIARDKVDGENGSARCPKGQLVRLGAAKNAPAWTKRRLGWSPGCIVKVRVALTMLFDVS